MAGRILLIDDEVQLYKHLERAFRKYEVEHAHNVKQARGMLPAGYDLVLLDLNLDPEDPDSREGLEYLPKIKNKYPTLPVIVYSKFLHSPEIKEALKRGACNYFHKERQVFVEWRKIIQKEIDFKKYAESNSPFRLQSHFFQQLKPQLQEFARKDELILFEGEYGVGKSSLARGLFQVHLERQGYTFTDWDIYSATARDLKVVIKKNPRGVILIRQIERLNPDICRSLIHHIDTRKPVTSFHKGYKTYSGPLIIATSDSGMQEDMPSCNKDLYYRFKKVLVPPLRERREDIHILIDYFLKSEGKRKGIKLIRAEALNALLSYRYPENISELSHIVDLIIRKFDNQRTISDQMSFIDMSMLPAKVANPESKMRFPLFEFKKAGAYEELRYIEEALHQAHGRKGKAATLLGISINDLGYKIPKHRDLIMDHKHDFPLIYDKYRKLLEKEK